MISNTTLCSSETLVILRENEAVSLYTRRSVPESVDDSLRLLLSTLMDVDSYRDILASLSTSVRTRPEFGEDAEIPSEAKIRIGVPNIDVISDSNEWE